MAEDDIRNSALVELYHRYVGEPESRRDVYGYWLFLLGSIAGLAGVLVFLTEQALYPGDLGIREVAIILAAIGLPVALFGVIVLLPVRRRGIKASVGGVLVSGVGIAGFYQVYPHAWYVGPDYSPQIIAVYSAGVAVLAAVAILVPIITGEKGLLVKPELGIGDDEPAILTGQATRDAFFTVYQTPANDWTWRAIEREAIGQSAQRTSNDTDARLLVEDVREKIGAAGLLDITTAAFRLYRTDAGDWRWSLVREDGSAVGTSADPYSDRDRIESAVNFLKEEAPDANVIDIRGAAFDIHRDDGGRWRWRLVDDQRRPLARSPHSYDGQQSAQTATETFVERLDDPRVLALQTLGIELFHDGGDWQWRLIDASDRTLLESHHDFESRRDAEVHAVNVVERVSDAAVTEFGTPGYEVFDIGGAWQWRLRNATDDVLAMRHGEPATEATVTSDAERTRAVIGGADVTEFEGADYEVYPRDDGWHWRLVAADRQVLADSTERFEEREGAEEAAARVREQALAAELIEFEQAAFQQYESDGEWRWRLIDEDGQVMADSGEEYESKDAVREGMVTLKEHAPDAEVLEIDAAAFEIYRGDDGEYGWRLVDEAGKLIATGATVQPSRSAAREAVDFILDHLDGANLRAMTEGTFQLFTDEGAWAFWLVHPDGTILAEATDDYSTRDDALGAIEAVRTAGDESVIDRIGSMCVQVRNGSSWHWRLIDADRALVADGVRSYEDREGASEDIGAFAEQAPDVPVFDIGRGIVWVEEREAGWEWRLVDSERTEFAVGPDTFESLEAVESAIETVQALAPEAGRFDIQTVSFELYRDDEEDWRWRLIDEEESILAVSAVGYETRAAVEEGLAGVRESIRSASILEIDEVAFEFHERDGGWIWRLIDENGTPLAESAVPHDSRHAAREEMLSLKEHGPAGELVVTW